jgi:hypothetical protein
MKFNHFGFQKENYRLLLIGIAINVVGFILMIGGGTDNPNNFNADELFSPIRITVSPMLIIAGYIVILYAILKKPVKSDEDSISDTKK